MSRRTIASLAALACLAALPLAAGCGKGNKGTNPATPLELNGALGLGGVYSHRFFTEGAYPYHCTIHSGMTGTIVVAAAVAAADSLQTVNVTGFAFSPATVSIPVGGKVTWTNSDPTNHTVTSD